MESRQIESDKGKNTTRQKKKSLKRLREGQNLTQQTTHILRNQIWKVTSKKGENTPVNLEVTNPLGFRRGSTESPLRTVAARRGTGKPIATIWEMEGCSCMGVHVKL